MTRPRLVALAACGTLAGLFALLAVFSARDYALDGPAAPGHLYFGTRFSALTSEVWRYGAPFVRRDLAPVPNNNPLPEPQPPRDRPHRVALSADGRKLYVTLQGTEAEPGREVAVLDTQSRRVLRRITVGVRPYAPRLHPDGRHLVVTNELSNYASVIDTTTDTVVAEWELDYYCHGVVFSAGGTRAFVANSYLDQVLVVNLGAGVRNARVEVQAGFDDRVFLGSPGLPPDLRDELRLRGFGDAQITAAESERTGGLNAVLRARCGACHSKGAGGYQCGDDAIENFLSAVQHCVGGRPEESPLLLATLPQAMGGYGDARLTPRFHKGGALFEEGQPELERLRRWIAQADAGPGIPVSNMGSHPRELELSRDGNWLFVANTGTNDVSVISTATLREAGAIHTGSPVLHAALWPDAAGRDQLVVLTLGAGFGAPPARDPLGGESWSRENPAAQFSILRDQRTTDPLPLEQQAVLGPFDAVDGTWGQRMRDIQNDLVAVDLSRLDLPQPGDQPDYLLQVNRYEAHEGWVRYSSDTAEATTGDTKGDIPPELQRVHGSFPTDWAKAGDRFYVLMAGSFEVVEYTVQPAAQDPANRLVPQRAFATGLRPLGLAAGQAGTAAEGLLFVANQLGESVSVINVHTAEAVEVVVGNVGRPPLDTDAEKGELLVHTSVFTSDGDTSCFHCHLQDTGDGRPSGAAEVIGQTRDGHIVTGGTLGIPQMRNIFAIQPYYFEGTHRLSEGQGADLNEPAGSVDFDRPIWAGDFRGYHSPTPEWRRVPRHEEIKERAETRKLGAEGYDLDERREQFWRAQALRYFGQGASITDLYRFTGAWLGNTTHLLPNPMDQQHPSVQRGRRLFHDAKVMCAVCHTEPEFTNKTALLAPNPRRALPPLTTITRRDASYTLASVRAIERANGAAVDSDPGDPGRVEDREGSFTTMQLRGILFRPATFLHHGRARSLREVLCTPGHPALRRFRLPPWLGTEPARPGALERGFNELTARGADGRLVPRDQAFDTHGGTSHLTAREIEDLLNFMRSIQ